MEQFYFPKDGYFDDDYYLKDHQGDLPSHLLLKGRKTKKSMRMVKYQVIKDICAEKQQNDIFIYLILFNLQDKAHKVVVILPILLNRKLRVTGVKQLTQSYTFNRANIAYTFCGLGLGSHHGSS